MNKIETSIASKKINYNFTLPMQLKVESYRNNYRFYYALKNDDFQLFAETPADHLLSHGFSGAHIVLYATSNGQMSTGYLTLIGLNIHLKKMKVKLLYVILLFNVLACKQSEINSQSLEGKILTSKTILFDQQIDDNLVSRPVIIETSVKTDNLKSYPIVIALHGRGGSNNNWCNPSSSQIQANLLGYIHKDISIHGI